MACPPAPAGGRLKREPQQEARIILLARILVPTWLGGRGLTRYDLHTVRACQRGESNHRPGPG